MPKEFSQWSSIQRLISFSVYIPVIISRGYVFHPWSRRLCFKLHPEVKVTFSEFVFTSFQTGNIYTIINGRTSLFHLHSSIKHKKFYFIFFTLQRRFFYLLSVIHTRNINGVFSRFFKLTGRTDLLYFRYK